MSSKPEPIIVEKRYPELVVEAADREVLRRLAARMAEIAARPEQAEKRELWYRHNALEATRPLIMCNPEGGWGEIITPEQMECRGELARRWENALRTEIFWGDSMGDDRVIEPVFFLNYIHQESGWGLDVVLQRSQQGGSYVWDAPLKSYEDMDKLRFPELEIDFAATERLVSLAGEVLGDILQVKIFARWWWFIGLTTTLVKLRGMEQAMLDMYDNPRELHRLMAFIRDAWMAKLDFVEQSGLLSLNNDVTSVGSGGLGYSRELPQPDFDGRVRLMDMWGVGESQETCNISPQLFAEFVFPYQLPILERFGLNCYGCCEPLNSRWHVVEKAPRLRRVSVSPWADRADMAEKLGDRYIYSMKPNPADLAHPAIDAERLRRELRRDMELTRGCRVEVIMKDNHTIGGNPQNVIDWCRIAREEAESL